LLLIVGCGGERTVTGRITYKQPLTGGQIHFIGSDGKSVSGVINPDGTYFVTGAPSGEVSVAVVSYSIEGGDLKQGLAVSLSTKQAPQIRSAIPTKYSDPKTSGLKYTIDSRSKKLDIELTD
jgi:hypothetical protein